MKIIVFLAVLSVAGRATTIYVDSEASNTINNSGHPTVDLTGRLHPNPDWAQPLADSDWISYGSTGDHSDPGYFSPRNGTVVTFTTSFVLEGAITGGELTVLADDSTSVILNGHQLIAADKKPGSRCAGRPIGCLTSTEGVFTFADLAPFLIDGINTLKFGVVQVNGSSFGLDFAGTFEDGTPEPATVAFIGAGLIALLALRGRKARVLIW